MNKILKITLLCLSLVSCLFVTSFSTFAYSQEDFATYGSIKYTELTSGGGEVADLVLPIIVNEDFPYYSRYTSGGNRTWQSLNFSNRYARIRNILPAKGMNGYVSSASDVSFTLEVAYPSSHFNNNYYENYVIDLENVGYGWTPIEVTIDVYTYDTSTESIVSSFTDVYSAQTSFDRHDLGISNDYIPNLWYCISMNVVFDPSENASDFTIVIPDSYQYFPFESTQVDSDLAYNEGFTDGFDEGLNQGYETGWGDGFNSSQDPLGLRVILSAVQGFLALEIIPGIPCAIIIECLLALSFIMIVSKLIAGG